MDSEKLFDLSGKLALITGASRGIGAEAAKTLARFGARVILSSRKREGLDGIAEERKEEGFEAMVWPYHCLKTFLLSFLGNPIQPLPFSAAEDDTGTESSQGLRRLGTNTAAGSCDQCKLP